MRGRAIQHYLEDLLAGAPVAWTFTAIFLVIALGLLVVVWLIARARRREDEELKERKRRRGY